MSSYHLLRPFWTQRGNSILAQVRGNTVSPLQYMDHVLGLVQVQSRFCHNLAPAPLVCNKAPTVHVTFCLQAVRISAITDKQKETVWHTVFRDKLSHLFFFPYLLKSSEKSRSSSRTYVQYFWSTRVCTDCVEMPMKEFYGKYFSIITIHLHVWLAYATVSGTCNLREVLGWFWLF